MHGFDRELRALLASRWNDLDEAECRDDRGEGPGRRTRRALPPDLSRTLRASAIGQLFGSSTRSDKRVARLSERAETFLTNSLPKYGQHGLELSEETLGVIEQGNSRTIDELDGIDDDVLLARAFEGADTSWPFGSSLWFPLCRADPRRTLRALVAAPERGDRFRRALSTLLSVAGESQAPDIDLDLTAILRRDGLPGSDKRLALAIVDWLRVRATRRTAPAQGFPDDVLEMWDLAASALLDQDDETSPSDVLTLDKALTSGGGSLAWALQSWMTTLERSSLGPAGSAITGRLDRLVQSRGSNGTAARAFLIAHLAFLHYVNAEWTEQQLVPLLLRQDAEARALWTIHAGKPIGTPGLFALIKPGFVKAVLNAVRREDRTAELAFNLFQLAIWSQRPDAPRYELAPGEIRALIRDASPAFRHAMSKHFSRYMASKKETIQAHSERWRQSARPTLIAVWPLDIHVRDVENSKNLVMMAFACDDAFPDAVDLIAERIAPYEVVRIGAWLLYDARSQELARHNAGAFVRLLDAILGEQPQRIPDDLPIFIKAARQETLDGPTQAALDRLEALRRRMP